MAKLYFNYSTMNACKSTLLLQASYNYQERGMRTVLFTAALDDRAGVGRIASRIGLAADAIPFRQDDDLFAVIKGLMPGAKSPASSSTRRSSCPKRRSGNSRVLPTGSISR